MQANSANMSKLSLTEAPNTTNKVCSPVFWVIAAELSSLPEEKMSKITSRQGSSLEKLFNIVFPSNPAGNKTPFSDGTLACAKHFAFIHVTCGPGAIQLLKKTKLKYHKMGNRRKLAYLSKLISFRVILFANKRNKRLDSFAAVFGCHATLQEIGKRRLSSVLSSSDTQGQLVG